MAKSLAVGIDIGGTLTKLGIVDRGGNIYASDTFSTTDQKDFDEFLGKLTRVVEGMKSRVDGSFELAGIGIGAPNANHYRGTIEHAANLEWKGVVPLVERARAALDAPVYLTNDANAAALGEMIYGKARGMKNFIVITLGTGLGSGIVSNGSLVYGHDSQAGELGHFNVERGGRECGTGRLGCLEAYASCTGIKRTVFRLLCDRLTPSPLRDLSYHQLEVEHISELANEGDAIALEAYQITGELLGRQLANFTAFSHPEAFFLLGGLVKSGHLIFEPTEKALHENLLDFYRGRVRLELSGLIGKNVAVLGSAALVWDQLDRS